MTYEQLRELGLSRKAIEHRLRTNELHRVWRGVFAVGRREMSLAGRFMAAVLACGDGAALSGEAAGVQYGVIERGRVLLEVTVPPQRSARVRGIRVRRRALESQDRTTHRNIPITSIVRTLLDLASILTPEQLERAVNEADRLGLIDPEALRGALEERGGQEGMATLRRVLDRRTFALTDSVLEQRMLRVARRVGLDKPLTGETVNGFEVDFFWPELGLVVETDGLTYHRTPAQQARDRLRDQVHTAAGLTPLRFTKAQVAYDLPHVERTLRAVAGRLSRRGAA